MERLIIDTHAHIFPSKIATKAVKNIGNFYGIEMDGSGEIDYLLEHGKKAGVTHFIVCSSATTSAQVHSINEFILREISDKNNVFGLGALHPDLSDEELDAAIDFITSNNLIGIKLHPDFQRFNIDDKAAYRIYERCEGKLPILFHTGDERYDFSAPQRLAKVAKDFPNLKCIGAHFGGYSRWAEIDCYLGLDNVYFDTSSALFKLTPKDAKDMIEKLGEDKFMFGVDFPMWEHSEEMERFEKLGLTETQKDKILFKNAIKFYGLEKLLKWKAQAKKTIIAIENFVCKIVNFHLKK